MAAATVPSLKISVLHYQPSGDPVDPVVEDVVAALKALGHTPTKLAVHDRVFDLLKQEQKQKCIGTDMKNKQK
jgi:D-alanine-D-alanine ligase